MTDGQIFLAVFFALYLSDCCLWSGRQAFLFFSVWRRRWKLRRPDDGFSNDRGGLLMTWAFPPLGTVFATQPWPLAVSEEGVGTITAESPNPGARCLQPERFLRWEEISRIQRDERVIYLNEEPFLNCAGGDQAARLAAVLRRIADADPGARSERIAFELGRTLRVPRVGRFRDLFFQATRYLRFQCNVLFVAGFVGVPLAYWLWPAKPPFFMVLLMVWVLMIGIALEAFALHRRFFPRLRGERWQHFFIQLFVPQHAMRAIDPISRHFLQRFHPLAVAKVLLDDTAFEKTAGQVVRDLRHPLPFHALDGHPSHKTAIACKDGFVRAAVEGFLREHGVSVGLLAGAPDDREEEAVAYCPRCRDTFVVSGVVCRDCGEMATLPIDH